MFERFKTGFHSRPPADTRVYAVGDIHGHVDRLAELQSLIADDAATAPERRRVVVYVGDYFDRGPDSASVIDRLIDRPISGFDSVFLKGNHEDIVLKFLDGDLESGANWIAFGGDATLRSYGVDCQGAMPDYSDLVAHRQAFAANFPARHRRFLETLSLSHVEGDYAFVHAGVRPGRPLADQRPADLMWIREEFTDSDNDHGHVIVHGHTPVTQVVNRRNRIGIDTGAGYGRELTAVVLSETRRSFLQA
ncbi:MAG: metallophosphoesterase family protein [Alphaproteobacteria bacterium]